MMNRRFDTSLSVCGLASGTYRKPTVILLLAAVLVPIWKYYGAKSFYLGRLAWMLPAGCDPDFAGATYSFVTGFILFGLAPMMVVRFVFRERLEDYGVRIGDWKFGLTAAAIMTPLMMALSYISASDSQFVAEYPIFKGAGASATVFLRHACLYLLYYLGYEMFMRGFIQHGLRDSFGDWNAILVQTAISCLFHIGKPGSEIFAAIPAGILWGIVVFRSRSLWYVLLVHWLLGISLDYFISFP